VSTDVSELLRSSIT